jgi:predicted nucleic acid-binding protein
VIHLDTSFLIRAGVHGTTEGRRLRNWLRAGKPVRISSVVWAEYLCGPVSARAMEDAAELFGEPVSFGSGEATLAAQLFNASGRRRGTLADCMIAATALAAGATLATSNGGDFARFATSGLRLES